MKEDLRTRVQQTRKDLRAQQIAMTFEEFDSMRMQLTDTQRIDKYKNMLESPFRFFRGSAYLFYYDMTLAPSIFHSDDARPTWMMGDMHIDNFGAFQNEQGDIVYDVNDFDEGYIGSYLYDLVRMSVSIGLYMDEQQIEEDTQRDTIKAFLKSYTKQLERFQKKKDDAFTMQFTKDNTKGPIKRVLKKLEKRKRTHLLEGLTEVVDGRRIFKWNEEVHPVSPTEYKGIVEVLPDYTIQDIAIKYGTGTASIGLKRYYILVSEQKDAAGEEDLLLEMKEARISIPAYFLPAHKPFWQTFEHQGARVVGTQRAMHHLEDPHLAFVTIDGLEYYIRERSPYKKKVKPKDYKELGDYQTTAKIMGQIAAKIHARAYMNYTDIVTYQSEDEILARIGSNEKLFIENTILQALRYKKLVYVDYELFQQWTEERFKGE